MGWDFKEHRSLIVRSTAGSVAAALLLLYFFVDPATSRWVPKCPTKMIAGVSCPGCGSQRLLHALLHGDIAGAWHANAFLLLCIPYLLLLGFTLIAGNRYPRLHRRVHSLPAVVTFLILATIWTIWRNIAVN